MFLERPKLDFSSGAVGGETAGLGELFGAARREEVAGQSSDSRSVLGNRAYEHFLNPLREATGEHIESPAEIAAKVARGTFGLTMAVDAGAEAIFFERLQGLAKRHPQASDRLFTREDVSRHAEGLARQAEGEYRRTQARSSGGLLSTAATFAGHFVGAMQDPVNFVTTFAVGPFGPAAAGVPCLEMTKTEGDHAA